MTQKHSIVTNNQAVKRPKTRTFLSNQDKTTKNTSMAIFKEPFCVQRNPKLRNPKVLRKLND